MMIPAILSIAFFLVLTIAYSFKSRSRFLPPGPNGLPIIGFLHRLGSAPLHVVLSNLGREYGDIFSVQLGSRLAVVLNSKEAIYETFVKKAKIFAGRPDLATFNTTRNGAIGISLCDYSDVYKQNRQMTIKVMHQLCLDKLNFNQLLQSEAKKMMQLFKEKSCNKEIFNPCHEFHKIVPNIMVHAMFGENPQYDDADITNLVEVNKKWFESAEGSNPADFLKFLERFPNKRLNAIEASRDAFYNFSLKKMEQFEGKECTGLYGSYATLMKKRLGKDVLEYDEKFELARNMNDMLGGGFDTLSALLGWSLLYLSSAPTVFIKCRQEIEEMVGDESVGVHHEREMHYCMAVVYEIIRICSVAPLGLPRKTLEEVKIRNYIIPKDTMVIPNLWAVNYDKTIWKQTEKFCPENFLDEEMVLNSKAVRNLASFSFGVRKCPGERFAVLQLFVMLTNFIKQFDFEIVKAPQDMLPKDGLTLQPKQYLIKVQQYENM